MPEYPSGNGTCFVSSRRKSSQVRILSPAQFFSLSSKALCTRIGAMKEICQFCKKERGINTTKYCSLKCQAAERWEFKKEKLERLGILPHPTNRKKYLLERDGHKCSVCKITEWQSKPVPLIMDHIDGNPENNKITNFRLVCGNCDMQLPTYKSKNRGNGRPARRIRYANGQSY